MADTTQFFVVGCVDTLILYEGINPARNGYGGAIALNLVNQDDRTENTSRQPDGAPTVRGARRPTSWGQGATAGL